jgi:hypothetical protein
MLRTPSGLKRRLFVAVCTLFLLLSQHTALAHALSHALDGAPSQHEHSDSAPKSSGGSLCEFHATIGQVLGGGVPASVCVLQVQLVEAAPVDCISRVVPATRFLAPLSRGPPALS